MKMSEREIWEYLVNLLLTQKTIRATWVVDKMSYIAQWKGGKINFIKHKIETKEEK